MNNKHIIIKLLPILALLLLVISSCGKKVQITEYSIIPQPQYLVLKGRTFTLTSSTRLCFENMGRNTPTAKYISYTLRRLHMRLSYVGTPSDNCLLFRLNDTINPELGDEGYLLLVRPEGIQISANSEAGLFYAFQTLVQMLPPDILQNTYRRITLPECTILDHPTFPWRANYLDVCRHFLTIKELERHLDLLATYKLNKLILHLSDDQAYRLESSLYPLLNDIASWRVDRSKYPWGSAPPPRQGEATTYGGFYTHQQIEHLVEYAAQRNIEIIPSIELPAHCSAILAAYPALSCDGHPRPVPAGPCWPEQTLICAAADSTLPFLCNLTDEITSLFPSEYILLGCSPALPTSWEQCPKCQALKNRLNIGSELQMQGWLISQIASNLSRKGKRIAAWDNLLDILPSSPALRDSLLHDALILASRGDSIANLAAHLVPGVLSSPPEYCSLDSYQTDPDSAFHSPQRLTLSRSYRFTPLPNTLSQPFNNHLWGGLATLLTHNTPDYNSAQYLLLPRLCAFAECVWSNPDDKDWTRFRHNIENHKQRLSANGYRYCPGSFKPIVTYTFDDHYLLVTINSEVEGSYIYYTTDGTPPTPESSVYTSPLRLPPGTLLRTITLYNGQPQEQIYNYPLPKHPRSNPSHPRTTP